MKYFHLDANAVNARQANPALNRLEDLRAAGKIEMDFSRIAYDEASAGDDVKRLQKVEESIWIAPMGQPEFEVDKRAAISKIVFPDGMKTDSQRRDVEILLTASMMRAILITSDGGSKSQPRGILGSKADLAKIGICVMTAGEALEEALKEEPEED